MPMQRQGQQQHKQIPWARISVAIILSFLFAGVAIVGIVNNLNSLFNILSIFFAVLGAMFALFQWFFPFSSSNTAEPPPIHASSLIPPITAHLPTTHTSQALNTGIDTSHNHIEQQLSLWMVPYRRNPFFTGREALLTYLHEQLNNKQTTALTQAQAVNGLGGIGKTQTAVEYAYRYRHEYPFVLWIRAATRDTLISDFVTIANMLQLSEKDEPDHTIIVAAVKRWLMEHESWLLILDNADDLDVIHGSLPTGNNGHILITTRTQAVGSIGRSIKVEKMDGEEGTLFLMRRARILAPESPLDQAGKADRIQAEAIVAAMDGLPLALDQAGAYIEETGCGLSRYLDLYHTHQRNLLQRRGRLSIDHPESVATTWSLSFQKIEQVNLASADLLRVCAFLDPDAIPEEILIEGAPDLGSTLMSLAANPLKFDKAIEEVLRYSLMRRNTETKTLSIHRLVQAVLRDRMRQKMQRQWAERAVRSVNRVFPDVELATWSRCQRYLPHAQACATFIDYYGLAFSEAARLLIKAGYYLQEAHAQYAEAESLFQRALTIREQRLGPDHLELANSLDSLAQLYQNQARYMDAESLFQRALTIREQVLGPVHSEIANNLDTLGWLYWYQGKYKDAESLFQRALTIREQVLGTDHPSTAISLQHLGRLYIDQGKYEDAESLLQLALAIDKQVLGPEDLSISLSLQYLGQLYLKRGRYKEAEPLFQRALAIHEQVLGSIHPETARSLQYLGWLYRYQGRYKEAEPVFQRALTVYEQVLKPDHPSTVDSLDSLGWVYRDQGKYKEAELLHRRALVINEQVLGPDHPSVAASFLYLGLLDLIEGRLKQAESLFQRALAITEQVLGPDHPWTADSLQHLGLLYLIERRYKEAEPLMERALTINEQVGPISHRIGILLEQYAILLLRTRRIIKALQTGVRGLKVLGLRETIRYALLAVRIYKQRGLQRKGLQRK